MLKTFTWNHYLMVVATLTAVYYVVIIIRYYKHSARLLVRRIWQKESGIRTLAKAPVEKTIGPATDLPQQRSSDTETPSLVRELTQHLKETIADAYQNQYSKEDLLLLLEMTLKDYLSLNSTPFQSVINELIRSECSKYGFIHLSVVELEEIWNQDV